MFQPSALVEKEVWSNKTAEYKLVQSFLFLCYNATVLATDLKTGKIFKEGNAPFLVLSYAHIKSARGGANVKVKARNLISGAVLEKSYLATAKILDADVIKKNAQYLYKQGTNFVFMDSQNFNQFNASNSLVGDSHRLMKEGDIVQVLYFEDEPVAIELPKTATFSIKYTEPGFKGNTATSTFKDATLENGTIIKVPTFIKIGDRVKINTSSEEYISKV